MKQNTLVMKLNKSKNIFYTKNVILWYFLTEHKQEIVILGHGDAAVIATISDLCTFIFVAICSFTILTFHFFWEKISQCI